MHTPNALLEFHGVPRHIQMHEAPCALQVDALATSARRDEKLRAVRIAERLNLLVAFLVGLATDDLRRRTAGALLQPS